MPDWKAENLRVTGFAPSAWAETAESLWAAVIGAPPEQINQRPREAAVNVEGAFEGARLVLRQEPKRTDWILVLDLSATSPPLKEFPSIGAYQAVSEPFLTLVKKWLQRDQTLNRLAFGGVLVLPVADREKGYRRLGEFLPQLKVDPVGSSELSYQINRPRTSKVVGGMRLNRLCKWSVALRQGMSIGLTLSPEAAEAVGGLTGPGFSACRLEFDINSDGMRKDAFATDQLIPLLDEFVALAEEVSNRGDVP